MVAGEVAEHSRAPEDRVQTSAGLAVGQPPLRTPQNLPHRLRDRYRLDADPRDPHQQVDDPLLVIGEPVRVETGPHGRVPGRALLVLIEHLIERRAVTEHIRPRLRRHAGQLRLRIQHDDPGLAIRLQHHLRRSPPMLARSSITSIRRNGQGSTPS